ncbi:MAG TPA: DegT/DnrJ/EryC1/StrS family aminotransferase [Pseudolabrys sp.]|nr:DegT/DnrJ/EryC1/StrS family aminotransferase [Pseudolabrys sp.]
MSSGMIPIARPALDDEDAAAAERVILSGWLSQGPEVAAFEREFATFVGAPHACAVMNCTAALHLALLAVGVRAEDEVITVSHSYIATANAIRFCGGQPVFVDIDPLTFNIDVSRIERAISARTRAILCVHQMGMPCDLTSILDIARRYRLPVIEDAACASGSEIRIDGAWQRIGRPHGDIACFSFHPRKVITTGDGGMLTTASAEWDRLFRLWRQHGMSVSDVVRHASPQVTFESYPIVGYNYRMTDMQAAVGRNQLRRLPDFVNRRRQLAEQYRAYLLELPGIHSPHEPEWARSNWQSYCVRLPDGTNQRAAMQFMLDRGVATRRGIMCAHLERAYWELEPRFSLHESEVAHHNCILLPLYTEMTDAEQRRVVEVLGEACKECAEEVTDRESNPQLFATAK